MAKADLTALYKEINAEFPRFRIRYKGDSWLMKAAGWVFGKQFMSSFLTTIGSTVYLPSDWGVRSSAVQCAELRHERVHMRQARRITFPLFVLLYALVLPVGLAWFRARFEQEAYAEQMAAWKEYGLDYVSAKERFVGYFTGSSYGFMWPFRRSVERWFDGVVARLKK